MVKTTPETKGRKGRPGVPERACVAKQVFRHPCRRSIFLILGTRMASKRPSETLKQLGSVTYLTNTLPTGPGTPDQTQKTALCPQ